MEPKAQFFIEGEWVEPTSAARYNVVTPSTEELLGSAGEATDDEVDAAVRSARRSFDAGPWRHLTVDERAAVIERAAAGLDKRAEELGELVTLEMGAPITASIATAKRASGTANFLADIARSTPLTDVRNGLVPAVVLRSPIGVVASIAPWNGPVGMAVSKIIPALLAGCSVVFKPAPETPFDIAFLVDALADAGLPQGVLNVVTGSAATGRALVRHPGVDKVSFTGSTAAGREIGGVAGASFTRIQLELGGKSAAIVLEDADPDVVLGGLSMGCFFNSGQVCAALSRVLAPRSRYEEIVSVMDKAAAGWVVGDPFDPATTMGPLVSERQRAQVESYIKLGVEAGARLVRGGGRPAHLPKGYYIEPTVFADVDNSMRIAREEIFGPVAVVIPYENEDEAIQIANDSEYGLHGAVFTADPQRAISIAGRVHTGTFSINNFVYNNRAPFGGVKNSGIGRDTGKEGYESFFELKTVNLDASTASLFSS